MRASFAWARACCMISRLTPVILMSICRAVIPSCVPATLKSMSPRWSSAPWMSVRISYSSPSLTRPIAMPETGAVIGTPASISASVEPQTEPIDDEPFDSSVSETMRIVYGNVSVVGSTGLERPLCECTVADVAPLRRAHATRLSHRVGREVVVVHVAPVTLEREVVDALAFLRRAERQQRHDLRLAAGEEARAVGAGHDRHLDLDRADLRRSPAVGATLLDRDLLADEALVDRLARLLDVALRQRVLDCGLAVDGGRADRERQLDALDDVLEEQVALRRLELLRVLLGVGEPPQLVLELLANDRLDRDRALLLEDLRQRHANLQLAEDLRLVGVERRSADFLLDDLLDDRGRLAEALLLDALPDLVAVRGLEPLGDGRVEPLRLALLRRAARAARRRASRSRGARSRAPRGACPRAPASRRPRPWSGRPSCRRRSGRDPTPRSPAASG